MKIASLIARILLGLIFVVFGINMWLQFIPMPPPDTSTPAGAFSAALFGSGYLHVIKGCEVLGGLLLLSGRFVNLGLAILGPIVINIALFHIFLMPAGLVMAAVLGVLALVALAGREDFRKALLNPR